ncbi:MAG: hypothetical protein KAR20_07990, partial [Candidatus Heimdallarchaeota archaeon]|nr:hypothetical protein [Candidatus Heimdallarchaeota archaeon]
NLHPPMWWMEENPDELVRLSDNEILRVKYLSYYYRQENIPVYSLVSEKWRKDAGKELKKLITLINKMPAGDSVIGYFMGAGSTAEWGQCGLGQGIDHGKAFKQHFSAWLHRKYKNEENLRQAWKRPDIDFNNIIIPSLEEKSGHYNGGTYQCNHFDEDIKNGKNKYALGDFINPDVSCAAIDFLLAMHHGIAESIEYFCRIAKECSNGELLTGSFHGELLQAGTRKILLESEYIDFLATPGIYTNRKPGEITDIRCPSESYALHNKIFIMEDDTRTHLAAPVTKERYKTQTIEDSITQMKRGFGRNLCRNLYGWWFDMHLSISQKLWWMVTPSLANGGSSWYDSIEILDLIKQQQQIAKSALNSDCRRISSIAVIMDESSTLLGSHSSFMDSINWRCSELARIGTPVDFYYCDDLDNPKMP